MNKTLEGKVAVVTGSSRGIGKALAHGLALKGARVVINGRNEARLLETRQALREKGFDAVAVAGDVSVFEDCRKLVDETLKAYGRLDILINNAGLSLEGEVEHADPDAARRIIEVNILGCVYPTQAAIPHLKKTGGSVLFISSLAGIYGLPNFSMYSASKMALTALAQSLKIELGGTGVHVGIAYVGFTENEPGKMVYNTDGSLVALPKRENVKVEPVGKAARRIIRMAEKRIYRSTFSSLGLLLSAINRISPSLVGMILSISYKKRQ